MRALIIGLGKSGKAAARLLGRLGYELLGVDSCPGEVEKCRALFPTQSDLEPVNLSQIDLVVVSPGVPRSHLLYVAARQMNRELIGEAELALRHLPNKYLLGVTGTNGKTTTTLFATELLRSAGKKARAVGNVGEPLSDYVLEADPEEILVVELSSYQLETLQVRRLSAAVLLNITPDHLDRYASMEEYAHFKWRIADCLKEGGELFVGRRLSGSRCFDADQPLPDLSPHERENALAAYALVQNMGVEVNNLAAAWKAFDKPHHRIEYVRTLSGTAFYDDSKGTNVDAVVQAVQSLTSPLLLIAGGVDKGGDYDAWREVFPGKVKKIFAMGQAAEKIFRELNEVVKVELVASMSNAVDLAYAASAPGETILLSPGCASFDMFSDYVHRGKEFQRCVHNLQERSSHHES